jgi:hypothetical protein
MELRAETPEVIQIMKEMFPREFEISVLVAANRVQAKRIQELEEKERNLLRYQEENQSE